MLFALLVIVAGGLILGAWVQALATRAVFAGGLAEGQRQRIAFANGRMLLRQCLLQNLPTGLVPAASLSLGNWGHFEIGPAASGWLTSEASQVAINHFSPLERNGFAHTVTANVSYTNPSGNMTNRAWIARMRSASPVYNGLPLVIHTGSAVVNESVSVATRALIWPSANSVEPGWASYIAPGARQVLVTRGAALVNFPWVPLTSGVAGVNNYNGSIAITPRTATQVSDNASTTADGIQVTDTAATRTIRLDLGVLNLTTGTGAPPPNLRLHFIANPGSIPLITSVRLQLVGGANATLPPLHVIYNAAGGGPDLTRIELIGTNARPVYVSVLKSTNTVITNSVSGTFRLGLLLQGSETQFTAVGTVTLQGGLRTNANVLVNSGVVNIVEDPSPGELQALADRLFWVEENRVP